MSVTELLLEKTEVFQARAAATGNARSPSVDRRVDDNGVIDNNTRSTLAATRSIPV